jgi:hypothetical protein
MNILVLMPSLYNTSPGSRFRIEQWAKHLEKEGFSFTFAAFEDDQLHNVIYKNGHIIYKSYKIISRFLSRAAGLFSLSKYDKVFLYEEAARIGPPVIERAIRGLGKPIVYDFCDPIFIPYVSPVNKTFTNLKFFGKYNYISKISNHVIVGNTMLLEHTRPLNDNVSLVPITIDTDEYLPPRHRGTAS